EEWYAALAAIEGAHGLEIPYRGGLHRDGAARLASLIPAGWHVVITMLPPTMAGIRANDAYGLSSTDDAGRAAALADVRAALAEAARLGDATGSQTVRGIYLTSAPRGTGTSERLARSLEALLPDANGVTLMVEHCDAWRDDRPVEKGFLQLDDELAAVQGLDVGQAVNWGRSVIEGRSTATAVDQLSRLRFAGTLRSLIVSGASATGGALGAAWADAHNPIDTVDPSSLLTRAEVDAALAAASVADLDFLGVKVQDPAKATDFDAHLEPLRVTVAAVLAGLAS
ncbi:MAG: hypothetical protein JWN36_691, partial [Microbacteriaceae bacterium]|nr:hypothetical protein [Microbacteriaceae bacterium]